MATSFVDFFFFSYVYSHMVLIHVSYGGIFTSTSYTYRLISEYRENMVSLCTLKLWQPGRPNPIVALIRTQSPVSLGTTLSCDRCS